MRLREDSVFPLKLMAAYHRLAGLAMADVLGHLRCGALWGCVQILMQHGERDSGPLCTFESGLGGALVIEGRLKALGLATGGFEAVLKPSLEIGNLH